jgi:hypothetical protein
LATPFVTWASGFGPELMRHVHRSLFGADRHPALIETSDLTQTTRLSLVARDDERAGIALPADMELQVPELVYRRVEGPPPTLEHGIVWMEKNDSDLISQFVRITREFVATG